MAEHDGSCGCPPEFHPHMTPAECRAFERRKRLGLPPLPPRGRYWTAPFMQHAAIRSEFAQLAREFGAREVLR